MSTDKTMSHQHHHAHHFRDANHEFESAKLGIWLFLATEILMFGGLFVGYVIYHGRYTAMFEEGASFLNWKLGAFNTVVLLLSSFTMAMGIQSAQKNNSKAAVKYLAITLICGAIFMIVKYFEYTHKFHLGLKPGELLTYATPEHANLGLYFSFYFLMTGLHGSHVLIGMGLIFWVLLRARKGEFNSHYYTPLEGVGLFWHLVDLIWIYLFPLLYLIK